MMVNKFVKNYVSVTYVAEDAGKKMSIYAGGEKIADVTASGTDETVKYEIPDSIVQQAYIAQGAQTIEGKDALHIKFAADADTDAPKLCGKVKIVKDYDTDAALSSLVITGGTLTPDFDSDETEYTLKTDGSGSVVIKATPADKYGLVYVNGRLINDEISKTLDIEGLEKIEIITKAADHTTEKVYVINLN